MAREQRRLDRAWIAAASLHGLAVRFPVDVFARIREELERPIHAGQLRNCVGRKIVAIEHGHGHARVLGQVYGLKRLEIPILENGANRPHWKTSVMSCYSSNDTIIKCPMICPSRLQKFNTSQPPRRRGWPWRARGVDCSCCWHRL